MTQEDADHDSLSHAYTFHSPGLHHAAIKFFEVALASDTDNVEALSRAAEAYPAGGGLTSRQQTRPL